MLSKLFSKRQKTESLPEKPTGNYRMVSEDAYSAAQRSVLRSKTVAMRSERSSLSLVKIQSLL